MGSNTQYLLFLIKEESLSISSQSSLQCATISLRRVPLGSVRNWQHLPASEGEEVARSSRRDEFCPLFEVKV